MSQIHRRKRAAGAGRDRLSFTSSHERELAERGSASAKSGPRPHSLSGWRVSSSRHGPRSVSHAARPAMSGKARAVSSRSSRRTPGYEPGPASEMRRRRRSPPSRAGEDTRPFWPRTFGRTASATGPLFISSDKNQIILHRTLSGNSAGDEGGGIFNSFGVADGQRPPLSANSYNNAGRLSV
jgi:hypothetical protein